MELPDRKDYSKSIVNDDGEVVQVHDSRGAEIPDPVPMAPPLGYTKPLSMFDQMRAQIRAEHHRLRQLELEELAETREQANDFEIDEDIENMPSLFEEKFDPVEFEVRARLRQKEFAASVAKRENELAPKRELLDGSHLVEGREVGPEGGSGGSNRKSEPVSGKEQKAGVQGSVREGSGRDTRIDGED